MNTYLVTLFPPVGAAPAPFTVSAAEFGFEGDVLLFFDSNRVAVAAVSASLNPLVQKTG